MSASELHEWTQVRCLAERHCHHRALERELGEIPRVLEVDRVHGRDTDSGHTETTAIARVTRWGTLPNSVVVAAVVRQGLTIVDVDAESGDAGTVRVTIR